MIYKHNPKQYFKQRLLAALLILDNNGIRAEKKFTNHMSETEGHRWPFLQMAILVIVKTSVRWQEQTTYYFH